MKNVVGIIDIKMGNLYSLEKLFRYLNQKYVISSNPKILKNCNKFILPGVGDFKSAMNKLKKNKWIQMLNEQLLHHHYIRPSMVDH